MFICQPDDGAESVLVIPGWNSSERHVRTHFQFSAPIDSGWQKHGTAAFSRCINRTLDRFGIVALSIAFGSESTDVQNCVSFDYLGGTHTTPHCQPKSAKRGGTRDLASSGSGFRNVFCHVDHSS
jgi:hypothetical protein